MDWARGSAKHAVKAADCESAAEAKRVAAEVAEEVMERVRIVVKMVGGGDGRVEMADEAPLVDETVQYTATDYAEDDNVGGEYKEVKQVVEKILAEKHAPPV